MKKIICTIMCGLFICSLIGSNYVMAGEVDCLSLNDVNAEIDFLNEESEICAELYNPETGVKVEQTFEIESAELVGFDDSGNPIIQSECEIEAYIPMMDNEYIDNTGEMILPLAFKNINNYCTNNNTPIIKLTQQKYTTNDYGFMTCDTKTKTKLDGSCSVTAKLTLTYTTSNNGGYYANLTKVNGGWTNSDRGVRISSREVIIGRSTGSKKVTYHPSSNTFSYNVNWGGAKWMAGASVFGATSTVTLNRGIGGNPWYLTLQCLISEDDF